MSSRLLPHDQAAGARPYAYRELLAGGGEGKQVFGRPPNPAGGAPQDQDRLRARVTELEQSLVQQVAAARQTGFREGEAAGRTQGEATVRPVIERMGRGIQEVLETKTRIRKQLEEEAVQLALAIGKRILHRELSTDPSSLQGLVQAAFERMAREEITRVVVHPDHVAAVREALAHCTTRAIEIAGDGGREKGTLIFETTRGALNASVDSQLQEIERGLADRLKWRQ
jgi:flagellar assembly protein FliH